MTKSDNTLKTTETLRPTPALLDELLSAAVRHAVGRDDVAPRPGQRELAQDIGRAMSRRTGVATALDTGAGQVVGAAPTGTGKSYAYITPAMMMAATRGERTVVTTESLSLQAQIIDKDAPVVAAAVEEVTGRRPSFAVLKGWSNYICAQQAATTAAEVVGFAAQPGLTALPVLAQSVSNRITSAAAGRILDPTTTVDEVEMPTADLLPLLEWALTSTMPPVPGEDAAPTDRNAYPGTTNGRLWDTVSTTPNACPGATRCPFGPVCAPTAARNTAAHSDIVVTNHSMLAVQAATGAPVIFGSRRLGVFDHVVVDEAHALPTQVRNQGGKSLDAWRILSAIKTFEKHVIIEGRSAAAVDTGHVLAESLDWLLSARVSPLRGATKFGSTVVKVEPEVDPLEGIGDQITIWVSQLTKLMPSEASMAHESERMKLLRAKSALASLSADVQFIRDTGTDRARWYEDGRREGRYVGAAVKASPVDVSLLLRSRAWSADVTSQMEPGDVTNPDAEDRPTDTWAVPEYRWTEPPEDKDPPRYALSVTCVSATLNESFAIDAGISVKLKRYESPFATAYAGSALYVPRASSRDDRIALTRDPDARKASFDTRGHPTWSIRHLVELVKANHGSALVLSATVDAGKQYADALRMAMGFAGLGDEIAVYSQWDGPPTRMLLEKWKADHDSVMVGTRSLMTGVDAPGQTCTLVVIDRVPRSAGNPVDDARVGLITEATGMDRWAADRLVYVSDAGLLLDQGAGRGIRAESDVVMIAVLDPRLLKSGPLSYPEPTRKMLMGPLEKFGHKFADLDPACEWLRGRRAAEVAELAGTSA